MSDYYYQKSPKKNKEIIKATRVSGVNNESVSQFTGDMYQQVNIYDNHVPVFGKNFISPIANNGFAHYKYYLLDSIEVEDYWCYHIRFMPKRKGELTFYGDLFIHDTTYAVRKVEGTIAEDANINFVKDLKVTQTFSQVEDEVWMLTKDELWVDINLADKEMGFYGRKQTTYRNFNINKPKPPEFYSVADNIVVLDDAAEKTDSFWVANRHDTLTANQLYKEFNEDENAALIKYEGKVVEVTGKIIAVTQTDSISNVVLGAEAALFGGVNCSFNNLEDNLQKENFILFSLTRDYFGFKININIFNFFKILNYM